MLHCCVIQLILRWSDTSSDLLGCYPSLRLILVTAPERWSDLWISFVWELFIVRLATLVTQQEARSSSLCSLVQQPPIVSCTDAL